MPGKLRVTQVKSTISHIARNRATIEALGLHRIEPRAYRIGNEPRQRAVEVSVAIFGLLGHVEALRHEQRQVALGAQIGRAHV